MKTIRDAINAGAHMVYCNKNKASIELPDMYNSIYDAISPPKIIDGKPVYRWIFCRIHGGNANTDSIDHRCLWNENDPYNYFHLTDYIAREREINEFISDNGGIDEYYTDYCARGWMYY